MRLVSDFKSGVHTIAQGFKPIKESFAAIAFNYMIRFGQLLPISLQKAGFLLYANKVSILTTNVRGPTEPYCLAGAKSLKCSTFMPQLADITGGFAIVSHRDVLWASFSADRYRCDDAKEIIRIFEETMD